MGTKNRETKHKKYIIKKEYYNIVLSAIYNLCNASLIAKLAVYWTGKTSKLNLQLIKIIIFDWL